MCGHNSHSLMHPHNHYTPCSLRDFESYLEFKEHSVENLQFVVWFQDYRRRFFELPLETQSLSPGPSEFSFSLPCPAKTAQRIVDSKKNYTWIVTSAGEYSPRNPLDLRSPVFSTYASYPDAPFPISQPNSPLLASVTPAPFIVPKPAKQPFRQECQAVVATFFKPGAPKELTLDSNVRDAIIRDLTWNTHPDVVRSLLFLAISSITDFRLIEQFLPAYEEAYDALSTFSLPHFLRLASENINLPKKLFWCTLGIVNLLLGLLIAVLLIVLIPGSNDSGQVGSQRAWRLFAVPLATLGGMQLFTAYKG